ncbi:MAG: hypothetical protein UC708_03835 [Anaerovoracaceae bacterium]|nr:hypothetical protein [Bacillota bacterium]MEE0516993.1 hypothetical protein [Anaerovoracaceae bacterium]
MKKKLLSLFIALILAFSCCSVAFAVPEDEGITPYETDGVTYSVKRVSATEANLSLIVDFSQVVDQYSVVIYLQKLSNGSWIDDNTNEDYVFYNNGWNSRSFRFNKVYDNLKRGVSYRIKCVSKDYIGSSSHIATTYTRLF